MKILIQLVLAIGFTGAAAWAQPRLHIAGTIKGAPDGTQIQLFSASRQGQVLPAAGVTKGTFTLEALLDQPDLYIMMVGGNGPGKLAQYEFFLENEIVELTIDIPAQSVVIVSGNAPMAFQQLRQQFGPRFDKLNQIGRLRQQAGNSGFYSDSLSRAWDGEVAAIGQMVPGFINQFPGTAVSAFLLNTLWPLYNDVPKMDSWLALMQPKAKDNVFGKALDEAMYSERLLGYGAQAPEFIQNDPNGKPVSLKDFRGKYVLVDFWASWCGPCRQENPNVVRAFERFKAKNFTVLGVSLDRDRPKWLQAIKDDGLTWPHVSDLKFWQNEVAKLYMVQSIPQNYLLDPEGRIIGKNLRGQALDEFLEKTLGVN